MKTWIITSAVTFVPDNYNGFVKPLASDPHIEGLIILDNRGWDIVIKSLLLILIGAAPRFGWHLFKNSVFNPIGRKKKYYESLGKKVLVFTDINSESSVAKIKSLQPDLILNARTRAFFRKNVLDIPKYGCLNIHHGLLPDQRGLMCDFWAHSENTPAGFSIHVMTSKLDDGALLKVVEVPSDKKDYLKFLGKAAAIEAATVSALLAEQAATGKINEQENKKTDSTIYRRNPSLPDFYKLRFRGVKI